MNNPGDFSFILPGCVNSHWRNNLKQTYSLIEENQMWDFMKTDPPNEKGYLYWEHKNILFLKTKIEQYTFVPVMCNMQFIAKHGWKEYLKKYPNVYI